MIRYYKLNEDHTVSPSDLMAWAEDFSDRERNTVRQDRFGDILVSTVFLGMDHGPLSYGMLDDDYEPVLFETMIFGGEHDQYQERYTSWDEALAGHFRAVDLVIARTP